MKLAIVEKKTFLAGLQCTLTSSCAKTGDFKTGKTKNRQLKIGLNLIRLKFLD